MNMTFSPVCLEKRQHYEDFWKATPSHSIDYSFVNIWGWYKYYKLEWSFGEKLCWLKQEGERCFWAPIGNWEDINWKEEHILNAGATLIRVPESLVNILEAALPGRVSKQEARGQWEYLYDAKDLATLPGNRFHKKRNHVNSFKKTYGEPDYRIMCEATMEDVLKLQDDWCRWHECTNSKALLAENDSINNVLSHWEDFKSLIGGTLYVNNELVAFSVGEFLDDTTLGVHYEKGRTGFRGVYQAMNTYFVQKAGASCALINRAQDLDEEGLRHAKTSYLPVDFLKKYTVTISPI